MYTVCMLLQRSLAVRWKSAGNYEMVTILGGRYQKKITKYTVQKELVMHIAYI